MKEIYYDLNHFSHFGGEAFLQQDIRGKAEQTISHTA